MDDEPDVGFVDSHAEGHCGDHDPHIVPQEIVLHLLSLDRRQAGMIGGAALNPADVSFAARSSTRLRLRQ